MKYIHTNTQAHTHTHTHTHKHTQHTHRDDSEPVPPWLDNEDGRSPEKLLLAAAGLEYVPGGTGPGPLCQRPPRLLRKALEAPLAARGGASCQPAVHLLHLRPELLGHLLPLGFECGREETLSLIHI